MLGLLLAPFAILLKLEFFHNELFILTRKVVYALAGSAGKLYKSIL